ncbi:MAG: TorF family putative porin [Sphingomonadaceae bacterium]|nr:TorF family putative porin [Sphingomonadaceae bacterium]
MSRIPILAAAVLMASAAHAADTDPPPPVQLSASVAAVSDYRFRGVSLSNRHWAAQGEVRLDSDPGFYGGVSATTVSGRLLGGAAGEADLYAGWTHSYGDGWRPDVGVQGYLYLAGRRRDFVELYGALTTPGFGPANALKLTGGINYAPDQANLRGDNVYGFAELNASAATVPLSLRLRAGVESGGRAGNKVDWLAGVRYKPSRLPFTFALSYVEASHSFARDGGAGVVFSVNLLLK